MDCQHGIAPPRLCGYCAELEKERADAYGDGVEEGFNRGQGKAHSMGRARGLEEAAQLLDKEARKAWDEDREQFGTSHRGNDYAMLAASVRDLVRSAAVDEDRADPDGGLITSSFCRHGQEKGTCPRCGLTPMEYWKPGRPTAPIAAEPCPLCGEIGGNGLILGDRGGPCPECTVRNVAGEMLSRHTAPAQAKCEKCMGRGFVWVGGLRADAVKEPCRVCSAPAPPPPDEAA